MSKVYAVRQGRKTGLFNSWDECLSSVSGYKGAEYKSFKNQLEAEAYLAGEEIAIHSKTDAYITIQKPAPDEIHIYTDGSYKDGIIGFGIYVQTYDKQFKLYGTVDYSSSLRNIAGELFGVLVGVQVAKDLGFSKITIFYDYEGIANWYNHDWSAKCDLAVKYVGLLHNFRLAYNLSLDFIKVRGHSNIKGNNLADSLASKAINVGNCNVSVDKIFNGLITCSDITLSRL